MYPTLNSPKELQIWQNKFTYYYFQINKPIDTVSTVNSIINLSESMFNKVWGFFQLILIYILNLWTSGLFWQYKTLFDCYKKQVWLIMSYITARPSLNTAKSPCIENLITIFFYIFSICFIIIQFPIIEIICFSFSTFG